MDAQMHAAGTSRLFRRFLRVHRMVLADTRPGPIAVVPNMRGRWLHLNQHAMEAERHGRIVRRVDPMPWASCGCLQNDAGAHRVGCPDFPEGVRP